MQQNLVLKETRERERERDSTSKNIILTKQNILFSFFPHFFPTNKETIQEKLMPTCSYSSIITLFIFSSKTSNCHLTKGAKNPKTETFFFFYIVFPSKVATKIKTKAQHMQKSLQSTQKSTKHVYIPESSDTVHTFLQNSKHSPEKSESRKLKEQTFFFFSTKCPYKSQEDQTKTQYSQKSCPPKITEQKWKNKKQNEYVYTQCLFFLPKVQTATEEKRVKKP